MGDWSVPSSFSSNGVGSTRRTPIPTASKKSFKMQWTLGDSLEPLHSSGSCSFFALVLRTTQLGTHHSRSTGGKGAGTAILSAWLEHVMNNTDLWLVVHFRALALNFHAHAYNCMCSLRPEDCEEPLFQMLQHAVRCSNCFDRLLHWRGLWLKPDECKYAACAVQESHAVSVLHIDWCMICSAYFLRNHIALWPLFAKKTTCLRMKGFL